MHFIIDAEETDQPHRWIAASSTCDLESDSDPLLATTCELLRASYGENELIAAIENLDGDVQQLFNVDEILRGFQLGLPDPKEESKKPKSLRNSRSESAEMVARAALQELCAVDFPAHPQAGKPNSNIPFPGYDGWGLAGVQPDIALVLIQVKATDENKSPPAEATILAEETVQIPRDLGKLSRAISIMATRLRGSPHFPHLVLMLQRMGQSELPLIQVAPVIVRGKIVGALTDLAPIRDRTVEIAPARATGMVVTIGVDLADFGERVMTLARAS